jgi:hypothetical protein
LEIQAMQKSKLLSNRDGEQIDIGLAPSDPREPLKSWGDDVMMVVPLPFMGRLVASLMGGLAVSYEPSRVGWPNKHDNGS